jgi:hypothetical protein
MATPGKFVSIVADALGIPEATVVLHDRYLVTAGLRTKGARGINAPDVTERDAAHLLTAILASAEVKDTLQSIKRYQKTRPLRSASGVSGFKNCGIKELARLPAQHSFLDALEALLSAAANRSVPKDAIIEVAALTPGTIGDIRIAGLVDKANVHVRYAEPSPWDDKKTPSPRDVSAWEARMKKQPPKDLEQYRRVSARTIFTLGETLATNDGGL